MTNWPNIEKAISALESEGSDVDRTHIPPAQATRLKAAFQTVDEPIDPERLASLFVYSPTEDDDGEFTEAEAAAFRTVEWRENCEGEPPWVGSP